MQGQSKQNHAICLHLFTYVYMSVDPFVYTVYVSLHEQRWSDVEAIPLDLAEAKSC